MSVWVSEAPPEPREAQDLRVPTLSRGAIAFWALANATVRSKLTYAGATLTALGTSLVGQAVFLLVWRGAVHQGRSPVPGLLRYLMVAFVFNAVFSFAAEIRFGQRLRQGLIATDLIRPLDFSTFQLAQALGDALANLVFAVPLYAVVFMVMGPSVLPADAARAVLGTVSLVLAFLINFGVSYLLIEVAFLTQSIHGAVTARVALHQTFSGVTAPLVIFPEPMRSVAVCLPFREIVATPVEIWLGLTPSAELGVALLRQGFWAASLLIAGRALLAAALRRHQVQGG